MSARSSAEKYIYRTTEEIIREFGMDQLREVSQTRGIVFNPRTVYKDFPAAFVKSTLCPILKNVNVPKITKAFIKSTRREMNRKGGSDDTETLKEILAYFGASA